MRFRYFLVDLRIHFVTKQGVCLLFMMIALKATFGTSKASPSVTFVKDFIREDGDVEASCMNDNNIRQSLFRSKHRDHDNLFLLETEEAVAEGRSHFRSKHRNHDNVLFLLEIEEAEGNPLACTKMTTSHRCAMASSFGPQKNCAWCISVTMPDTTFKCVPIADVDFYEDRDFICAPHATAVELASGQPGVRFGKNYGTHKANENGLIPRRRPNWGNEAFCGAMEAVFGGGTSSYMKDEDVKKRMESIEYMDEGGDVKKLTVPNMNGIQTNIWDAVEPDKVFVTACRSIVGDICSRECVQLSWLYKEASRPGFEAMAGARTTFTQNWELNEADYFASPVGSSSDEDGGVSYGSAYVPNKKLLGRHALHSLRPLALTDGDKLKTPGQMHTLKYLLSAKDCVRCLRDGVCMPDCLNAMSPCGGGGSG